MEPGAVDPGPVNIERVTPDDLADLLPLMRAYCTFYESDPADEELRALATAFLAEGAGGTQLIARDASGRPSVTPPCCGAGTPPSRNGWP